MYKNILIIFAFLFTTALSVAQVQPTLDSLLNNLEKIKETGTKEDISSVYQDLIELYTKKNDYQQAYKYQILYKEIEDSIYVKNKNTIIDEIEKKYQIEKKKGENALLIKNIEIKEQNEKKQRNLIWGMILGVFSLFLILSILFYLYKLKNQSLKKTKLLTSKEKEIAKITMEKIESENKLMETEKKYKIVESELLKKQISDIEQLNIMQKQEIEAQNRQLSGTALLIMNKNEMFNKIQNELKTLLKDEPKLEKETQNVIREITNYIKFDNDWEDFKKHFDEVHKGFFDRLQQMALNLTSNDLRLCAYLRINLGTKEIAQILNIQAVSVYKINNRIRKKIDIDSDIDLSDYLSQL